MTISAGLLILSPPVVGVRVPKQLLGMVTLQIPADCHAATALGPNRGNNNVIIMLESIGGAMNLALRLKQTVKQSQPVEIFLLEFVKKSATPTMQKKPLNTSHREQSLKAAAYQQGAL